MSTQKKIAVILCGSGYKDGSEIRESVLTLLALSQANAKVQCFAPNDSQTDVVNCLTGEIAIGESRNMLVEAARIARADVLPLSHLKSSDYDSIILPGGFGAAKNLCDFASKGGKGSVRPDLLSVLKDFYSHKKSIGAICIAPVILALAFKNEEFSLTLGAEGETAAEVVELGHKHIACPVTECVIDRTHKIFTTPAYMYDDAILADVFKGISALVREILL
jgi:enhancing lycopene biosynthesis protein 2